MKKLQLLFAFVFLAISTQAQNNTPKAYADVLLDAYYSQANPQFKGFYGGSLKKYPHLIDPKVALGKNDNFVSLPTKSYVVLGFTDNSIIDAPRQKDIFIQEAGGAGDYAAVYVSADGKEFVYLGKAWDGRSTSFDLATINFKKPVIAIKIVGLNNGGASPGFDVVSVSALPGAIGEAQNIDLVTNYQKNHKVHILTMPTPKITTTLKEKNVYFAYNRHNLHKTAKDNLTKAIQILEQNPAWTITLEGHTDNVGTQTRNMTLSQKRAEAVQQFLEAHKVAKERIKIAYFGEDKPTNSNATTNGRAKNRRVVLKLIKK